MLKDMHPAKIVVLGMGNPLLQDDGVGVHLVHTLNTDELECPNLEIIDAGTSPEIASLIEGADKLIIIDAVKGGKEPGTIYRFSLDDVQEVDLDSPVRLSLHQVGVIDNLRMLKLLEKCPRKIIIIGVEPQSIGWGLEPSPKIKERLAELKRVVIQEIRDGMPHSISQK